MAVLGVSEMASFRVFFSFDALIFVVHPLKFNGSSVAAEPNGAAAYRFIILDWTAICKSQIMSALGRA